MTISEKEMKRVYEDIWLGEIWNNGDLSHLAEIFADSFTDHRPIPEFENNVKGHGEMAQDWCNAFPDLNFEVQEIIIQNNFLVGRYIAHGTHRGTLLGIPATGTKVSITGIDIFRFRKGLVTDWWHEEDFDNLMRPIIQAHEKRSAK